jgi:beta-lactamase class A
LLHLSTSLKVFMNKVASQPGGLFGKQLPLSLGIGIIVLFGIAGIYFSSNVEPPKKDSTAVVSAPSKNEGVMVRRQKGYELAQPLMIMEVPDQSPNLFHVRDSIQNFIDKHKGIDFEDASVHLLKQNSGEWIGINYDKPYPSKGYLRIAVLISFLKMSENHPEILNTKVLFDLKSNANYPLLSLQTGRTYSVRDLLGKMMLTQDTTPKFLLIPLLDKSVIIDLYDGLGLGKPDFVNQKFPITASGYSKLLNVIYNGRFLSETNAEYALKLLSNNNERVGLLKMLPEKSKVIHKMSTRFENNLYEIRETGIIYCNDDAYLLTIFINGKNKDKLENACGDLGKLVYDEISVN